jgi:hypothetical protein
MFDVRRAYPLILIVLFLSLGMREVRVVWLAVVLVAILLIRPDLLRVPSALLETVGRVVGTALSNSVLSIIFIVCVVPYSFLYRYIERATWSYFFDATKRTSTFVDTHAYTQEQFKKTW